MVVVKGIQFLDEEVDGATHRQVELESENTSSIVETVKSAAHKYLMAVAEITGCPVDERIARYINSLHLWLPYDCIIIAQSPYPSEMLPDMASSLAINPMTCHAYPPSVSVLAQFLSNGSDDPATSLCNSISMSYMLVEVGMMFVNVYPCARSGYPTDVKLISCFAELIRCIVVSNMALQVSRTLMHCLGEEASRAASIIQSSIKSNMIRPMTLSKVVYRNPVWLVRQFHGSTKDSSKYDREMRLLVELYLSVTKDSGINNSNSIRHRSSNNKEFEVISYSYRCLRMLGSNSALLRVFRDRVMGRESSILEQYTAKLKEYACSLQNKELESHIDSSDMTSYKRATYDAAADYRQKTVEYFNNSYRKSMECDTLNRKAVEKIDVLCNELLSKIGETEEVADLKEIVSECQDYLRVMERVISFYTHIPTVATQSASLIATSGNTVPPILKAIDSPITGEGIVFAINNPEPGYDVMKNTTHVDENNGSSSFAGMSAAERIRAIRGAPISFKETQPQEDYKPDVINDSASHNVVDNTEDVLAIQYDDQDDYVDNEYSDEESIDDINYEATVQQMFNFSVNDESTAKKDVHATDGSISRVDYTEAPIVAHHAISGSSSRVSIMSAADRLKVLRNKGARVATDSSSDKFHNSNDDSTQNSLGPEDSISVVSAMSKFSTVSASDRLRVLRAKATYRSK